MEAIDLIEKYEHNENIQTGIARMVKQRKHPKFKIGDEIEFLGGFHGDILYKSKIVGFNDDGGIYVIWDCYWLPIYDTKERKIIVID